MNTTLPFAESRVTRLSLVKRDDVPRRFTVHYSTTKLLKERGNGTLHLWGCRFPGGSIALENLVTFESMRELEAHFERAGNYTIEWYDEE